MKKSVNTNDIVLKKNIIINKKIKKNVSNIINSINNLLIKTNNKKNILNYNKLLKKSKKIKSQKGGNNVITESVSLINTMKSLGNSIFKEISDITRIGYDINNVASSDSIPNNNIKTTTFQAPNLKNIPTR